MIHRYEIDSSAPSRSDFWHDLGRRAATTEQPQDGQGVDAQYPAAHQRDHDGANADAAPTKHRRSAATSVIAAVFHVVGLAIAFPFHCVSPAPSRRGGQACMLRAGTAPAWTIYDVFHPASARLS